MEYYPRKIEEKLENWISSPHVIILRGPRQSGKTTLLKHLQSKYGGNYLSLEFDDYSDAIKKDPLLFVKTFIKERFLFLDEAQYVRDIGKYLKLIFDHIGDRIKIFVTGSGSFEIKENLGKYLVGRALYFELLPLSFDEYILWKDKTLYTTYLEYKRHFNALLSNDPTKLCSLKAQVIYTGKFKSYLDEFLIYGGYPAVVKEKDEENKAILLKNLVLTYLERDVFYFLGVKETEKFKLLLKAYSMITGSLYEISNLANDLKIDFKTLQNYQELLQRSYVIDIVRPYYGNHSTELKKMPKLYFYDTGIRNAILGNFLPLTRRTDIGALLENHVFSELKKAGLEPKYWRKTSGAEVDFVIEKDSDIIPIEVKTKVRPEKSFFSFMNSYSPKVAALLGLEQDEILTMTLAKTLTLVYPVYLI